MLKTLPSTVGTLSTVTTGKNRDCHKDRNLTLIVCQSIAIKANSSEIYIYDTIFEDGQSLAIGSIGQFLNWYEFIENVYARNITLINTR